MLFVVVVFWSLSICLCYCCRHLLVFVVAIALEPIVVVIVTVTFTLCGPGLWDAPSNGPNVRSPAWEFKVVVGANVRKPAWESRWLLGQMSENLHGNQGGCWGKCPKTRMGIKVPEGATARSGFVDARWKYSTDGLEEHAPNITRLPAGYRADMHSGCRPRLAVRAPHCEKGRQTTYGEGGKCFPSRNKWSLFEKKSRLCAPESCSGDIEGKGIRIHLKNRRNWHWSERGGCSHWHEDTLLLPHLRDGRNEEATPRSWTLQYGAICMMTSTA
ncbi:hypothetical protein B0H13DRAFT_1910333 [Mycena leptocephala]|nr:hypothetical protein B0H13DRAFT_1910333 [Mycena leptocephala]